MDAKLGIFIHWGAYAVPAFGNEWYPRWMYRDEVAPNGLNYHHHHVKAYGHPGAFGYKDFIPLFRGERWDPAAWVMLFQEAGARYVVSVAKHHDGFAMYDTRHILWNATRMGPRRDIIGELARTVCANSLEYGVSSHRPFNWRYYTYREDCDTTDPAFAGLYSPPHGEAVPAPLPWLEDWFARTTELFDRYRPDILWFDFGWQFDEFSPYRPRVTAYYYNRALEWGKEVVLNCKDKFPAGTAVLDIERGKLDHLSREYWQTDASVSYRSWGYIENDKLKSVRVLVHDLVDIVSKNGNLLLNAGPRADGSIPDEVAGLLRGLGHRLSVNGEAIYGTRPWYVYGEGPTKVGVGHLSEVKDQPFTSEDVRFTCKGSTLYAIFLGWPGRKATIRALAARSPLTADRIERTFLLAVPDMPLLWRQDAHGLHIKLPAVRIGEHTHVLKIVRKG